MSYYEDDKEEYTSYWEKNTRLSERKKFRSPTMAEQFEVPDICNIENNIVKGIKSGSTNVTSLPDNISKKNSIKYKPEYIILKAFYPDEYLSRCANAFLFDDVINSAIERLSYFTLGTNDEIRSVLYPVSIRPLKSEAEAKKELEKVKVIKSGQDVAGVIVDNHLSEQEVDEFETFINYTDHICNLGFFIRQNYKASHVFSRSACYIEYADKPNESLGLPVDTPIGLKPLKPMYLGNVAIDPISWNIKAIQYKDNKVDFKEYVDIGIQAQKNKDVNQRDTKYLNADNILYFVRNNNNMMREDDDFYFGHSTLQCIMSQSEENRRINQIVIPQINQGHWAGTGYWTFPNWSESMMKRFFNSIKPGGQVGLPDERIKFQESKLTYDYQGIINLKDALKRQILSVFGLPSFLMNFEDVTNRATSDTVVTGFNESTIQAERSWVTSILDRQWYPKLFRIFYPNDEFLHIKMKMNIEFENISFESFYEKAVAVVALIEKKIMTITEGRNMLKLPPLLPEDYIMLGIPNPNDATMQTSGGPSPPSPANLVDQFAAENELKQVKQQNGQAGSGSSVDMGMSMKLPTPTLKSLMSGSSNKKRN